MKIWQRPLLMWLSLGIFIIAVIMLYGMFFPESALIPHILPENSAELSLDVPRRVNIQQPFQVVVRLNTLNNKVNAAGITMRFDPQKLQVMDMDTRDSFCQFYPERNYDNSLGQVQLACGSPHPGYTGENAVLRIQFMPTAIGSTRIYLSNESQVLASDGKGTNILETLDQADIQITNTL